jgi:hypothetical protein
LRAGVAEDDLPEKALGAGCFDGFKVAHAILNSAKRRQAFCVPKGLARSRATGGRRNGIYGGDPLCGEQAVYAGFALPLTESKPARRQPGEHCRRQCGGVATHGTIQPDRRAAGVLRVIRQRRSMPVPGVGGWVPPGEPTSLLT